MSTIGILGGVGPEAGLTLHQHIINSTKNQKHPACDQEHLTVYHLSCSELITDRTEFLKGNTTNPAIGAAQVIERFEAIAKSQNERIIVGVPCNTFHAPKIWAHFTKLIADKKIENIEVLHMIELTKEALLQQNPDLKKVGLLSTTGTRQARVYQEILEPFGIEVIEVPERMQQSVHDAIYHPDWGIKSSKHDKAKTRLLFEGFAKTLKDYEAQAIILGCTEIPLVLQEAQFDNVPLIDPMKALADELVRLSIAPKHKPKVGRG